VTFPLADEFTPLGYQWSLNSSNILGATNSNLVISSLTQTDLGFYTVLSVTLLARSQVQMQCVNVSIYCNPVYRGYNILGKGATFSVSAWGTGPLIISGLIMVLLFRTQLIKHSTCRAFNSQTLVSTQWWSVARWNSNDTPEQVVVEPAGVSLGFCPALTISGVVGYSYVIQSATNLMARTAGHSDEFDIDSTIQIWVDTSVDASSPFYPYISIRFCQVR